MEYIEISNSSETTSNCPNLKLRERTEQRNLYVARTLELRTIARTCQSIRTNLMQPYIHIIGEFNAVVYNV